MTRRWTEILQWLTQSGHRGPGMTKIISVGVRPSATLIRWSGLDSRDSIASPASHSTEAGGSPNRPGGGSGNGPASPSGADFLPERKTSCQLEQINPRRRRGVVKPKRRNSSPARRHPRRMVRTILFSVLSNVRLRAHYAMNSVRIPHDGTSHAPPSSSTGHGDN